MKKSIEESICNHCIERHQKYKKKKLSKRLYIIQTIIYRIYNNNYRVFTRTIIL